jgi:hypothetical protein
MVLTERFGATRYVAGRRPSFRETELRSYPENPWTGIHAGREFLYDLRHPLLFGRRVIARLRGQIPQVGRQQRYPASH